METKVESVSLKAPNLSYNKYEFWRKDSFWGNETFYVKAYNRNGSPKILQSSKDDWGTIKYGSKLINDIFDYKIGDFQLDQMQEKEFQQVTNCLYGADITSIDYDRNSNYCHLKYKKGGSVYQFNYQNEALYGLSADVEHFEISIIAKTMFQQNTRVITFKNNSYKDVIRIFWGLALWRNAYIGDILTHKYFVFNNPTMILDQTMNNWLSSYNLVNRIKDSDWI